jgi:hypothetical protein
MTARTKDEWQAIMDAKAASPLSNVDFCRQHNIPIQTFYYQRHARCLCKPQNKKRLLATAKVEPKLMSAPTSVVVQTHHAQVSLSSQCDPLWLAAFDYLMHVLEKSIEPDCNVESLMPWNVKLG